MWRDLGNERIARVGGWGRGGGGEMRDYSEWGGRGGNERIARVGGGGGGAVSQSVGQ